GHATRRVEPRRRSRADQPRVRRGRAVTGLELVRLSAAVEQREQPTLCPARGPTRFVQDGQRDLSSPRGKAEDVDGKLLSAILLRQLFPQSVFGQTRICLQ